ncbi:PCL7 [Candida theae]|uniref:PCL7 n=1 Tax=Candida theae TaxID=1198502 RepID=A0AAD5BEE9_9ASCO|nr:PCL7 [Candida theae]KAI5958100.1 PCL7 [Candida theae]
MSTNYHHNDSSTTNHLQSASLDPSTNIHQSDRHDLGNHFPTPSHSARSQVSNLTKTLQSSSNNSQQQNIDHTQGRPVQQQQQQQQQQEYGHEKITGSGELITGLPYESNNNFQSSSYQSHQGAFSQQIPIAQNSYKHIPMSHNTPTVVGTSYTSAHSYNPSLPSTNNFITQPERFGSFHDHPTAPSSFRPSTVPHALPTTTVQTDPVVPTRSSFSTAPNAAHSLQSSTYAIPGNQQHSAIHHPTNVRSNQFVESSRIPNSLPVGHTYATSPPSTIPGHHQDQQQPQSAHRLQSLLNASKQTGSDMSMHTGSISIPQYNRIEKVQQQATRGHSFHSTPPYYEHVQQSAQNSQHLEYVRPEPDHYLTYNEFLQELRRNDEQERPDSEEEHLNIVEFPVNDLIVMLSCLLTKIIEANDKLHPNHFENTIAVRQKIKEERKRKRLQRRNREQEQYHQSTTVGEVEDSENKEGGGKYSDNFNVRVHSEDRMDEDDDGNPHDGDNTGYDDDFENDEDDEEDNEMKNKYLANVLAFHGTNVPGISLHAYLARVLKYCPVTNEVFLSLLVYFDRIAKKANNLNQKRRSSTNDDVANESGGDVSEAEQLFVMDSYNIHRLIISGITVSSKFFSDIFYKNLRYAKVGGLPLEELNYLELQFLLLLDFKLMISVEDLQNYGDLLARFWKREQQQSKDDAAK